MKPFLTRVAAASVVLLGGVLVAACGGGGSADTTPAVKVTSVKVQARSTWSGSDIQTAHEVATRIALELSK